jgi:peptide subunit release factor 1 (eRF1)
MSEPDPGERRRASRKGVLALCERLEDDDGRAVYLDGGVLLEVEGGETVAVQPPFRLAHQASYDRVETAPLRDHLLLRRRVGLLAVRLGGYAAAIYEDEQLVAGRGGSRFVKNRNRKGGSSSNRFRRRREEQARELHDAAAELAIEILVPAARGLDELVLAGDRFAIDAVLERSAELTRLAQDAIAAPFQIGDPRSSKLEPLARELWSSTLTHARRTSPT